MAKPIVVTGGASYIGSHTCKELARQGYQPIVIDDLIYGHEWAVKWGPFHKINLRETDRVAEILKAIKPEAIVHFAAFAYVGESVKNPLKYYENNVLGTLSLLSAMKAAGVSRIVFSSTCATYGVPSEVPIRETTPQNPINPYGQSKLMVEKILKDLFVSDGLSSVSLRYFNAAGADPELELGEDHDPETHLIPLAIEAAFQPDKALTVFGQDYPTPDGTCVRDYIHVADLATAHVLSLKKLEKAAGPIQAVYNLGTGVGSSVLEVIQSVERASQTKVERKYGERRPGDPPRLVASGDLARSELGWVPQYSDLDTIVGHAVGWYKKHVLKKG